MFVSHGQLPGRHCTYTGIVECVFRRAVKLVLGSLNKLLDSLICFTLITKKDTEIIPILCPVRIESDRFGKRFFCSHRLFKCYQNLRIGIVSQCVGRILL